jgi:hypothetical protein
MAALSWPTRAITTEVAKGAWTIQVITVATKAKDDLNKVDMMVYQNDSQAVAEMIAEEEAIMLPEGTQVQPIKSEDLGTMWLVREVGSSQGWWVKVTSIKTP